jgi:parallel beta-helix repeat protein
MIQDNIMEGNGWGISLFDGMNIDISGNCIEGTGGPAVIAAGTSGLRVSANYFESNNAPGFGGPMILRPASGSGPNITVQADILLNGASDLYANPWPIADTYASSFLMDNVLISANYHACGPECPPTDANCTDGKLNGMPQSGTLIVAADGVTIQANSLYQVALGNIIPAMHEGHEGQTGCPVANPLVVTGTLDGFFARNVRLESATGWDSEQGYAYLYGDPNAASRMFLETFVSEGPTTRANFFNASLMSHPAAALGLAPMPVVAAAAPIDGHAVVSVQTEASGNAQTSAAMLLAEVPLVSWPSLGGRALFAAVDIMALSATTSVGLSIDNGDGVWRTDYNSPKGESYPFGNWSRVTFQCVAAKTGVLRVALQLHGDGAHVNVGAGAIGVVGAGWSRLVDASPLGM